MVDELNYAFNVDFPQCEEQWVAIKPYDIILRLVARAGSRVFVGKPICRDDGFIDAAITFTSNIFQTMGILRMVPGFLHPVVGPLLPSTRRLKRQLRMVKQNLLMPLVEERRGARYPPSEDTLEQPDDFLQWMMDLASNAVDAEAENLAHRLLGILSMAVVHTSAMTIVHVLYDLILMSEYQEPLRTELEDLLPRGWGEVMQGNLVDMGRLDSFLRESQRHNPPGHVSFSRIVKKPIMLHDGTKLPKGAHICMPSGPISKDSSQVPNASEFDGFRWFREKKKTASFVHSSPTSLHFGLGKYACPGRFFAVYMIKAILSRILLEFDFKFEEDLKDRPMNMVVGDKIVPNLSTRLCVKKRSNTKGQRS